MQLVNTAFEPWNHLKHLFAFDMPGGIRCQAVLNGDALGRILLDRFENPTTAFLQEFGENTLFPGGAFTPLDLAQAVEDLRLDRDVVLSLWPDDPLASQKYPFQHPRPHYIGAAIDLTDRDPGVDLEPLAAPPLGCSLQRINLELFQQIDHTWELQMFGSLERALEKGLGYCLVREGEVLSQAFAGPSSGGLIEIGAGTPQQHRRKGYGTVTCARLVRECEQLGYQAYWNAAAQNTASLNLAVKLGFSSEQPHRVYWWQKAHPP